MSWLNSVSFFNGLGMCLVLLGFGRMCQYILYGVARIYKQYNEDRRYNLYYEAKKNVWDNMSKLAEKNSKPEYYTPAMEMEE